MKALKKESENLQQASEKLLELSLKIGAENAEVCSTFDQKTCITLEKQDYQMASQDQAYQFGIRVQLGAKQGFFSTNSLDPKDLKEAARQAFKLCLASPENEHNVILSTDNVSKEAPNFKIDSHFLNMSMPTIQDWTKMMIKESLKDPRFCLSDGSMEIASSVFFVANAKGTQKVERDALASWSLMGMASEGDNITSFDYFSSISRSATNTPHLIVKSTEKFTTQVLQALKTGPAKSYKGLVAFSPRAVKDIMLSTLAYHLNGRSVVEKTSRWTLQDMGTQQLDPRISLIDSPWQMDRLGFSISDREGHPTFPMGLIKEGTVGNFLLDNYSAHALDKTSNGHAQGGPTSPPTVGAYTLLLEPGTTPYFELMKDAAQTQTDFLLVNRYSGSTDPITGDFSGVAKGAQWWHQGERMYTVKETLISGNVFDALSTHIFGLSKESEVIDCNSEAPTLILDGISVTSSG